jgi:hypothetical protein
MVTPAHPRDPQLERAIALLRAGAPLDTASRQCLLQVLQDAPPKRGVGFKRLALREQGWPIHRIARAEGATEAAVQQSIRRARRERERTQGG